MDIYNQPYTYVIGWTHLNKYYYGVRYAKKCNPLDLWVSYFTSSNFVKRLREKEGEPDIKQVRKIFNDTKTAILYEAKVLRRLDVLKKDKWLNMAIVGSIAPMPGKLNPSYGRIKSDEEKRKISEANLGRKMSDSTKKKISLAKKGRPGHKHNLLTKEKISKKMLALFANGFTNPFQGRQHTEETKALLKEKATGLKRPYKERVNNKGKNHHFYGKPVDEQRKAKIKTSALANKVMVSCIICKTESSYQNFIRWHKNRHLECVDC